jgi:hypothetical protein
VVVVVLVNAVDVVAAVVEIVEIAVVDAVDVEAVEVAVVKKKVVNGFQLPSSVVWLRKERSNPLNTSTSSPCPSRNTKLLITSCPK